MSRFRSQFKRGGAVSLVRSFGETIVYYSRGLGSGRSIQAIVRRNVAVQSESGEVSQVVTCSVLDDVEFGILATEIDDGRDTVALSLTQGGDVEIREITRMDDDSNGMVRFIVR